MPESATPPAVADIPGISAARRRWIVAACCVSVFMVSVESSIVATATPSVVAALGGFEYVSWVFAAYLLAQAVAIPI